MSVLFQTKRTPLRGALLVALLFLLIACAPMTSPTPNGDTGGATTDSPVALAELEGTEWLLASYGSPDTPTMALPEPPITLMFSNQGEIHGSAGCNNYFATYQEEGATFTLSGVQHTEMACMDPGAQQQENTFLNALRMATTVTREGEVLSLPYEGGELRFALIPAPEPTALSGSQWELVSFNIAGTVQSLIPGSTITAEFTDEEVLGSSGCNQYGAAYTLNGQSLTIEPATMTQMACMEEGIMTQETTYLAALTETTGYTVEGDSLVLQYQGGELRFTRVKPAADLTLEGTPWTLNTFVTGETASSLLVDTMLTASFEAGSVSGTSGCNQYSGSYTLDGDALKVGGLAATKIACPNEILEQESGFLRALEAATSFTIEGNQLTILHPSGMLIFDGGVTAQR